MRSMTKRQERPVIDFRRCSQDLVRKQVRRAHRHRPAKRTMSAVNEQAGNARGADHRPAIAAHRPQPGPWLRRIVIELRRELR